MGAQGTKLNQEQLTKISDLQRHLQTQPAKPIAQKRRKRAILDSKTTGGKWLPEEDELLRNGVRALGAKNWKKISEMYLSSKRTDVQCLHRWQKVCIRHAPSKRVLMIA